MKKINYQQYYYDGSYDNSELILPDECHIYEVSGIQMTHRIGDSENTKAYVLINSTKFDGSVLVGNVYMSYLDDVNIINSELLIQNPKDAPKFENVYLVRCIKNTRTRNKIIAILNKVEYSEQDITDLKELYEETKQIYEICQLRYITSKGIEMGCVYTRNQIDRIEIDSISINSLPYDCIWTETFSCSENIAIKFKEFVNKVYNSIIKY